MRPMSELMERAIQRVTELPEKDQESIASIILREIESRAPMGGAVRPSPVGRRPLAVGG